MKKLQWRQFLLKYLVNAIILTSFIGCNNNIEKNYQSQLDTLEVRFVPDKRVGIFNVTAKAGEGNSLILKGETTSLPARNEIIKTLGNRGIKLIDSIIILPDTLSNDKFMGLVTLSVINLRKEPDHASELVSQAILGTPVKILKSKNSWLLIQTPDNYIAWTEKSSLAVLTRLEMDGWKKGDRVIYTENSGWIYSSIDKSGIVGDLVAGCILLKTGELAGFVNVCLPDGRNGFVEKKALMEFNEFRYQIVPDEKRVIRIAESLLGVPYLWGGSSAKGVDCSGFAQRVYFMNGILLERDASLQALHGKSVNISDGYGELKMGDLLFFGSKGNSKFHITHVAVYKGNNEYINSSGRVLINSLDSTQINYNSYRRSSLLQAKRILGVDNDRGIVKLKDHEWY